MKCLTPRDTKEKNDPSRETQSGEILLDAENEQDMIDTLTEDPVLSVFTRAGISTVLNPVFDPLGGILGTAIGFIIDLFDE